LVYGKNLKILQQVPSIQVFFLAGHSINRLTMLNVCIFLVKGFKREMIFDVSDSGDLFFTLSEILFWFVCGILSKNYPDMVSFPLFFNCSFFSSGFISIL